MPKINVLPKTIAELIAAGEVVERPASVIKELVENSVDAGSKSITVEIQNGGITYMRVTDNGCGISREDVPTAFISHATSKIKTASDLDGIFTLGFRGEALASVASVARVELLTRTAQEDVGTSYFIEGGKQTGIDDAGCPQGTTIVVRDLFFNTPARMKFLKKDVSEANAVAAVLDRLSMSHPEISFRFIRDGKQTLITAGDGKLDSCVRSVLGREVSQTLIPVEYELEGVRVSGLVSKPSGSRATRSMQFFYLNSRFIKSTTAMAALEQAYKGSVMVGRFPACVLNIGVSAHTVDVNVHPAKTEVRFSDEKKIFNSVYYAVKSALTRLDSPIQVAQSQRKPSVPVPRQPETVQLKMNEKGMEFWKRLSSEEFTKEHRLELSRDESVLPKRKWEEESKAEPVNVAVQGKPEGHKTEATAVAAQHIEPKVQTVKLVPDISVDEPTEMPVSEEEPPKQGNPFERIISDVEIAEKEISAAKEAESKIPLQFIGEAFKTYIIVQQKDKLIFIDKHAAHERMIYEKLRQGVDSSRQTLLSSVPVTLSKSEYSAVIENLELIAKSGYEVEDFGSGTVIVRECPMYIDYGEIPIAIGEIAAHLVNNSSALMTQKLDWLLHNSACRAAIKAGDKTPEAELESFAEKLIEDESIRYCPHGRPVMIELTKRELEKMFGR